MFFIITLSVIDKGKRTFSETETGRVEVHGKPHEVIFAEVFKRATERTRNAYPGVIEGTHFVVDFYSLLSEKTLK